MKPNDTNWHPFEHDPVTHKTTYMRFTEDGKVQIKETIPMWLATAIMEDNKARAKAFDENGGWKKAKAGAIIAAIPHHLDKHFKEMSGQDISKSGEYDQAKYNSFLDDSDYSNLRTGGGRIGKRLATGLGIKSRLKTSVSALVVP